MKYFVTCTCGENVSVDAEGEDEAVGKLVPAMDQHVASAEHPDIPKDMSQEQKVGMVRSKMQKEP